MDNIEIINVHTPGEAKEERLKQRRRRRIVFWGRIFIILLVIAAVLFVLKSDLFSVKEYNVSGNSYYSAEEIITMGNCKTGGNIFIGTDLKDIKERLLKDAYMEDVKVKRVLPSTVEISVTERVQAAAIAYGTKYIVISPEGIVLRKTGVEPMLTLIRGMTISKLKLGEVIETEENVELRQALKLVNDTNANNMFFKAIQPDNGEMKAYILDGLVCCGTSDNILEVIKDETLQKIVQTLFDQGVERGTIKVTDDGYISFSPEIS